MSTTLLQAAKKLMIETIGGRRTPRIKVESDTFADGASRDEVMNAMAGHVLAKGELVGLYEAPLGSER